MTRRRNQFTANATYYNVSANSLFITFVVLLLAYYAWKQSGWTLLAKSLLATSLLLLLLTIGIFFSKLSTRKLVINNEQMFIGKRSFLVKDVTKIECIAVGKVIHIHLKGVDETLTLRMKEED